MNCTNCNNKVHPERAALGYKVCIHCADNVPQRRGLVFPDADGNMHTVVGVGRRTIDRVDRLVNEEEPEPMPELDLTTPTGKKLK